MQSLPQFVFIFIVLQSYVNAVFIIIYFILYLYSYPKNLYSYIKLYLYLNTQMLLSIRQLIHLQLIAAFTKTSAF